MYYFNTVKYRKLIKRKGQFWVKDVENKFTVMSLNQLNKLY